MQYFDPNNSSESDSVDAYRRKIDLAGENHIVKAAVSDFISDIGSTPATLVPAYGIFILRSLFKYGFIVFVQDKHNVSIVHKDVYIHKNKDEYEKSRSRCFQSQDKKWYVTFGDSLETKDLNTIQRKKVHVYIATKPELDICGRFTRYVSKVDSQIYNISVLEAIDNNTLQRDRINGHLRFISLVGGTAVTRGTQIGLGAISQDHGQDPQSNNAKSLLNIQTVIQSLKKAKQDDKEDESHVELIDKDKAEIFPNKTADSSAIDLRRNALMQVVAEFKLSPSDFGIHNPDRNGQNEKRKHDIKRRKRELIAVTRHLNAALQIVFNAESLHFYIKLLSVYNEEIALKKWSEVHGYKLDEIDKEYVKNLIRESEGDEFAMQSYYEEQAYKRQRVQERSLPTAIRTANKTKEQQ